MVASIAAVMECPHCQGQVPPGRFCRICRRLVADPTGGVELVTYNRRFWGDGLLEFVLFLVTLVIGWFIWLIFTARTGQTPAKRLLNVYILDTDTGTVASAGKVWFRDVLIKLVFIDVFLGAVGRLVPRVNFSGIIGLVDDAWILFDRDRQALHDKVASTIVVYAPLGPVGDLEHLGTPASGASLPPPTTAAAEIAEQLRELARLHEQGILTDEEYERKRSALAQQL